MRKAKVILPILAIVIVAGFCVGFTLKGRGGGALAVQVEPVKRRTVVQKVTATGKIQPKTQVNISADVSAKITRLEVKEGQWVEKGQLLFELDRERYVAALESAEANLRAVQSGVGLAHENMAKAVKDLERTEQLFAQTLESQSALDAARATAEVEKARYQSAVDQAAQASAAVKQYRDDLAKTTIYAPLAGTVSKLNKEVGEICLGSQFQADVVMIISNLAGMEALVNVDENDIVQLKLLDKAEIEVDALPNTTIKGEVTEIAASAKVSGAGTTDQKTEFEVKVGVTDPVGALRPGMTASAEIVTDTRDNVLSVPIQSVTVRTLEELGAKGGDKGKGKATPTPAVERFTPDRQGFVSVVWVVKEGAVEARQVKTGIQGADYIEITDGLSEGDQVVVGSFRAISRELHDGSPVRIQAGPVEKG